MRTFEAGIVSVNDLLHGDEECFFQTRLLPDDAAWCMERARKENPFGIYFERFYEEAKVIISDVENRLDVSHESAIELLRDDSGEWIDRFLYSSMEDYLIESAWLEEKMFEIGKIQKEDLLIQQAFGIEK